MQTHEHDYFVRLKPIVQHLQEYGDNYFVSHPTAWVAMHAAPIMPTAGKRSHMPSPKKETTVGHARGR